MDLEVTSSESIRRMTGDRRFISSSTSAIEEIVPLSDFFSMQQDIRNVVSKHLTIEPKQNLVLQYTDKSTILVPAINLRKLLEVAFSYVHYLDPSVQADTILNISPTSSDIPSIISELLFAQVASRGFNYSQQFATQRYLQLWNLAIGNILIQTQI